MLNEKSAAARERQEAVKADTQRRTAEAMENAKWVDEGTTAKEKRAAAAAAKAEAKAEAAAKKKALLEAEEAENAKLRKAAAAKAIAREDKRLTLFELQQVLEQERVKAEAAAKMKHEEEHDKILRVDPLQITNVNHHREEEKESDEARFGKGNVLTASSVDGALRALSIATGSGAAAAANADRFPEKRRKAAYKAWEEERMPELKADFPGLKYSQLKEKLFEEWQKSPANPVNQAAAEMAASKANWS